METDAQLLVQAVNSNEQDLTPNGVLFRELKALAFLNLSYFSILYCPRSCNKVVDALATFGAKMVSEPQAVWPGQVPTFAQLLVASDLAAQYG